MMTDNPERPGNFTRHHDGTGNPNYNGVMWTNELVGSLNNLMIRGNREMAIGLDGTQSGPKPAVHPFKIRFMLDGHDDNEELSKREK